MGTRSLQDLPEGTLAYLVTAVPDAVPAPTAGPRSGGGLAPVVPMPTHVGQDPLSVQLPGEEHSLNEEQQAIVDIAIGQGRDLVVKALAGTGKTSTLQALASRLAIARPGENILYIAFNKGVQVEAKARMPANVEARTGHSLAWQAVGKDFWGKTPGGKKMLTGTDPDLAAKAKYLRSRPASIAKALGLPMEYGELVTKTVDRYAVSADDEIEASHVDAVCDPREWDEDSRGEILDAAREYWEDITTPLSGHGKRLFAATQDHLRKIWALRGPDFTAAPSLGSGAKRPARILFLDEAQDTPPVLARVVDQQVGMQQTIVGDANQAIYGFAGSMDYLDSTFIDASATLATSYRFGHGIESVANRFLEALGTSERVIGQDHEDHVGAVDRPDAVLTRTNAGMLDEIVFEAGQGRTVGLLASSRQDLQGLVQTTAYLRDGGPLPTVWHPVLRRYDTWAQAVKESRSTTAAGELQAAMGIVSQWSIDALERIVEGTTVVEDAAKDECDVVIATAHKSKGLQWPAVRIAGDFYGPDHDPPAISGTDYDDPEHLRLAYVAVTRARTDLDLGSLRWINGYRPKRRAA